MAVAKEIKETIAVTIDEVFKKMNSISWLERQKAMKDEAFKNTEKILYCFNILKEHVADEEGYLAMIQKSTSGSIVRYQKNKVDKPDEDQLLEDRIACRMEGKKLTVKVKGTIVKNFVLADEYNITNTKYEETIDSMVNVVKIYDENKKQVGEVKNGNWIDKYGIYQQIYTKEKGINAETAAKNMLSGVEKKVTLDGINGDLSCIAGNGVEVYDKATGLNGVFWIDSDTHTWENGTHIMSLELNFKNIMDSKEYDETEE